MINAKEARELSQKKEQELLETEVENVIMQIENEIEKATKKGVYKTSTNFPISIFEKNQQELNEKIIQTLEQNGYKVKAGNTSFQISW